MKAVANDVFFSYVESEIAEGRSVRFRMKGISMHPFLRNGRDDVVLYPCRPDELKPMDVVLFRYQGKHLLHRILRKEGDRLQIQGDGSFVAKEECLLDDVVGIVREFYRPSGKRVSVDSRCWKLFSRLWRMLGCFRNPILRIYNRIVK